MGILELTKSLLSSQNNLAFSSKHEKKNSCSQYIHLKNLNEDI